MPGDELVFHKGSVEANPDVKDDAADALCIFIDSKIGASELERFPALKLIATRSTGFDHIDLAACAARGVAVASVPSYGENTVAEFAFALILALSRRIIEANDSVRDSGTFKQEGLRGFDLAGKTLGIVGGGHIGEHAIRMGGGFGMTVVCFDVHQDAELAAKLGFSYVSLDELFARSDVISLHVPYNPHTHHLINRDAFAKMKKGAYLVNTARGAVVETEALVEALKNGTLAGAGLDVLEEEGDINDESMLLAAPHPNDEAIRTALANNYLIDHPRVIVTPHVAFDTLEAVTRIIDTTIGNIEAFSAGAPANIVHA
ncbi:hydroxyacid dehydrogenase [Patescibacteria group bacterium]|nr:hydroxyacid dehydrogenase [Patescibacteria group bacterium]